MTELEGGALVEKWKCEGTEDYTVKGIVIKVPVCQATYRLNAAAAETNRYKLSFKYQLFACSKKNLGETGTCTGENHKKGLAAVTSGDEELGEVEILWYPRPKAKDIRDTIIATDSEDPTDPNDSGNLKRTKVLIDKDKGYTHFFGDNAFEVDFSDAKYGPDSGPAFGKFKEFPGTNSKDNHPCNAGDCSVHYLPSAPSSAGTEISSVARWGNKDGSTTGSLFDTEDSCASSVKYKVWTKIPANYTEPGSEWIDDTTDNGAKVTGGTNNELESDEKTIKICIRPRPEVREDIFYVREATAENPQSVTLMWKEGVDPRTDTGRDVKRWSYYLSPNNEAKATKVAVSGLSSADASLGPSSCSGGTCQILLTPQNGVQKLVEALSTRSPSKTQNI